MAGVRLEWAQFGDFDSFDVIRSDTSMADITEENLPTPIATNLKTMYYVDTNVILGSTYFYKVRAWRDNVSKTSDEMDVKVGAYDEYWNYVDLLIFADSTNSISTTVVDTSTTKKTISLSGDTKLIKSKFGNPCAIVTQYARWSTTASSLLTSDFTIEFWYHSIAGGVNNGRLFSYSTSGANGSLLINKTSNAAQTDLNVMINNGSWVTLITTTGSIITGNNWQHICLMRSNGGFFLFVDGVLRGTSTTLKTFSITDNTLSYNGWNPSASEYHYGIFGSCRVSKGKLRYSLSGFSIPTTEFAIIASDDDDFNSVDCLLIPNLNNMIDKSNNARTITNIGTAFYLPERKYDEGTLFFDGDTDGLTSSITALGNSDFTLEFFINMKGSIKNYPRIGQIGNADSANGCAFVTSIGTTWGCALHFWTGVNYEAFSAFSGLLKNNWYHVCMMRKNGAFYIFVDGVLKTSNSSTPFVTYNFTTGFLMLGRGAVAGTESQCGFNSIRLTRFARYNTNGFTAPTEKFPNK